MAFGILLSFNYYGLFCHLVILQRYAERPNPAIAKNSDFVNTRLFVLSFIVALFSEPFRRKRVRLSTHFACC